MGKTRAFLPEDKSDGGELTYELMHATEQYNIPGVIMFIDFKKAFDSISWKFLYIMLHHFG